MVRKHKIMKLNFCSKYFVKSSFWGVYQNENSLFCLFSYYLYSIVGIQIEYVKATNERQILGTLDQYKLQSLFVNPYPKS